MPASSRGLWETDAIIPTTGKIREKLESWIDDSPGFEFFYESISRRLDSNSFSADSAPRPLSDAPGFSDLRAVAEDLVSELNNLPQTYSFFVSLPA